jgi:tetratricopeptide (TPR) repeat protein
MARALVRGQSQHNWVAAGEDFDKALQLSPESALVHYRRGLWFLAPVNRMGEAIAETQRAAELDPLSVLTRGVDAFTQVIAGKREDAVRTARAAIELMPTSFIGCFLAGFALGGAHELDEALATVNRGLDAAPANLWLTVVKSAVLGRMGRKEEVVVLLGELTERSSREYVPSLVLGVLHAVAGDLDSAFRWLEAAIDERQSWTAPFLISPLIRGLLPNPRYNALLKRLNLPER